MTAFIVCIVIACTVLMFAMPGRNRIYDNGFTAGRKRGLSEGRKTAKSAAEAQAPEWAEKLLSAGFEAGIAYAETGVSPNFEKLLRQLV